MFSKNKDEERAIHSRNDKIDPMINDKKTPSIKKTVS